MLLFSCYVVSDSWQPHGLQHTSLSLTISQSLLKLKSIESVMPSNHLILCRPLLLLPAIFPTIKVSSTPQINYTSIKIKIKNPKAFLNYCERAKNQFMETPLQKKKKCQQ